MSNPHVEISSVLDVESQNQKFMGISYFTKIKNLHSAEGIWGHRWTIYYLVRLHQFIVLPTVNEKTSLHSVLQSCAATTHLFRDTEHLLCQVLELFKKK